MPEPVLVVEDDPDIRDMMIAVVENEGHRAVPVENGAEALRLLRNGLRPCLILVDPTMPVKNVWEFRAEQSADPHLAAIPTIAVAAAAKEAMRDLHPDGTVSKLVDLDTLARLLKAHCISNHRVA
ncbi:MAG: response regulator [Deltaproteobacteria bacterium]|nr:response regulator [Deltaproteobacteria bacterium]